MPGDSDGKTGDLIKATLALKHPEARDVDVNRLPEFDSYFTLIDTVVTGEIVERNVGMLGLSIIMYTEAHMSRKKN